MEYKKERMVFENTYRAVNVKSKEILSIKVTDDEHVHDSKALPELVENIIKSDNVITIDKLLVLMAPMTVMIFLDIWETTEYCHALKLGRMLKLG